MSIIWRIERKIRKRAIRRSRNPRPSSYPFISGDTFRSIANHIYDATASFDPKSVATNDVIFVQSDMLDEYFLNIHPQIQNPYKLITHNSDRNITQNDLRFIDDTIIRWFAQNALVQHPKITPIPIGIENAYHANAGLLRFFKKTFLAKKTPRILVNFNVATNPGVRGPCKQALAQNPLADIKKWKSQPKFVRNLQNYAFVASPAGNGIDCHRTWEALYLKTVPIVERSVLTEYFKKIGLPLLLVDDWNKLLAYTIETIGEEYAKTESVFDHPALHMEYWRKLILNQ